MDSESAPQGALFRAPDRVRLGRPDFAVPQPWVRPSPTGDLRLSGAPANPVYHRQPLLRNSNIESGYTGAFERWD